MEFFKASGVRKVFGIMTMTAFVGSCGPEGEPSSGTIAQAPFGSTPDGEAVELFTMRNAGGMEVRAISYFTNLMLMAAFFGIGLGCILQQKRNLSWMLPAGILLVFGFVVAGRGIVIYQEAAGVHYYSQPEELCARAFEAFVQDADCKNAFLVRGTRESEEAKLGLYPQGEHRDRTNHAFRDYFHNLGRALPRADQ